MLFFGQCRTICVFYVGVLDWAHRKKVSGYHKSPGNKEWAKMTGIKKSQWLKVTNVKGK